MKQPLSEKLKESLKMFLVFFKIGLFSFGGGYAMLAMIEHEVVDKRSWLTHGELLDIFAIAESTPGAISINIATFIGTKRAGVLGGCITTLGVVLPAFLVILALSYILDLVRDNKWVNALFTGVRVGVVVLIIHAALKFLKKIKKKVLTVRLHRHLDRCGRARALLGKAQIPRRGGREHPALRPRYRPHGRLSRLRAGAPCLPLRAVRAVRVVRRQRHCKRQPRNKRLRRAM